MKKLLLFSWPVIFGKAIMWPVYYIAYPAIFHWCGIVWGYLILSIMMWSLSAVFVWAYDVTGVDFLRVREAKIAARDFIAKVLRKAAGVLPLEYVKSLADITARHVDVAMTIVIAWHFFPAYSVLGWRREGKRHLDKEEMFTLLTVTLLSNVYWTVVAHAMIFSTAGIYNLIRS